MGRVEEAMRRAANARARNDGLPVADDLASTVGVVPETFPVEAVDRPRLRTVPSGAEAPPRLAPASSSTSLFERLDVGLSRKTVIDAQIDPTSREQYRRLAATLHAAQAESGLKVIMIASALPSEGKTLTAANLALTFSESYRRSVLLIDGDLRKPSLHAIFNLPSVPGLSEGLMSADERKLPIHRVSPTLTVLTAGHPNADPMAALVSERTRRLVDEARETFDWVIIDTPPIGLLSDASLLAALADRTILVVKAGVTPYGLVQRALTALGRDRVLGVVLNRATEGVGGLSSGYYGMYYGGQPPISVAKG